MNSYERVMLALECREPDRVPVAELFVNKKFVAQHFPGCSSLEFADIADLDVAMVQRSSGGFEQILPGRYRDRWGTIYADTGEEALIELECPLSGLEDLRKLTVPDPATDPRLEAVRTYAAYYKGRKALALQVSDCFSRPRKLLGMENLLMGYIEEPDFIHELVEIVLSYTMKLIELAVTAGVDIIVSSDDYAGNTGPFMSPRHFEEFILPGLKRLVQHTHELGAKYIKHTDGDLRPILEQLVSSGIDGLHPIEEYAGMNLRAFKKNFGERVCIIGSVDCRKLLCDGTPREVEDVVEKLIEDLGRGGGLMIASSNSIHSGVNPGNFTAMVKATRKHGRYPMRPACV